jgi:hypothetical protein
MIRVRYRDSNELSPGLHAAAECHGRTTTVYLLSGLTKPQPAPSATQAASSGVCLKAGPLGVCLKV